MIGNDRHMDLQYQPCLTMINPLAAKSCWLLLAPCRRACGWEHNCVIFHVFLLGLGGWVGC